MDLQEMERQITEFTLEASRAAAEIKNHPSFQSFGEKARIAANPSYGGAWPKKIRVTGSALNEVRKGRGGAERSRERERGQ